MASVIDTVVNLAKRRGLVFQSGEIYGGTKSAWDYGPLGVELKENIKRQWWRSVVTGREDVVGLDSAIILPREVWVASGHVEVFNDPLVECLNCHKRHRQDHMQEAYAAKKGDDDPDSVPMTRDRVPGLRHQGAVDRAARLQHDAQDLPRPDRDRGGSALSAPGDRAGHLRQLRQRGHHGATKPPFGIGQIGKSFRNEITPGNFIFRTREFEQMEMEFFVEPATAREWHKYWIDTRLAWYVDLGINRDNLRLFEHPKEKLSHYSDGTVDIEYKFGFQGNPWGELEGIANRTDFDLSTHSKHSGIDLSFYDQGTETRYMPYVIEPAAGLTRSLMAFLVDAYHEDEAPNTKGGVDKRTVLRLDPRLAPVKAAVLPLSRHADLSPKARDLAAELRKSWNIEFDDAGAIGRRYRRQDEIGTPFCVTLDFESLEDQAVTIRERDAMTQERVAIDAVSDYLAVRFKGCCFRNPRSASAAAAAARTGSAEGRWAPARRPPPPNPPRIEPQRMLPMMMPPSTAPMLTAGRRTSGV